MPEGWQAARLGDLLTNKHGYAFSGMTESDDETQPIVVGIGNFQYSGGFRFDSTRVKRYVGDYPAGFELRPGEVLLAMTCQTAGGEILGIPGVIPDDGRVYLHNQRLGRVQITSPDRLDLRYVFQLARSVPFNQHLFATASGSKILHTSPGRIEDFILDLPPLPEQRAIAATLGALDDKIESNRRATKSALELARVLVKRAVEGKAYGPAEDAMSLRMGSAFKGSMFTAPGRGRPLLRIRDLKTFEPQTWTAESREDEVEIRPGDVVVGMDAEFRATIWRGPVAVLNQRVCTFRGRQSVSRAYMLVTLAPNLALQERAKSGTTVIHLNKSDIASFAVPVLDQEEHRRLAEATDPLLDRVVHHDAEAQRLAALRDALLPELLSGRIRVPVDGAA